MVSPPSSKVWWSGNYSLKNEICLQWLFFAYSSAVLLCLAMLDLRDLAPAAAGGLRVYGAFWDAGWAASHGANPFAAHFFTDATNYGIVDVNLSPPAMLPLFQLLPLIDPRVGAQIWLVTQALLFIIATTLLLTKSQRVLAPWEACLIMLLPAIRGGVFFAQDYGLLYVPAVLAWLFMRDGRSVLAGVAIGFLAAAKPNFGVLPLLLLVSAYWRIAGAAIATMGTLMLLPVPLYGLEVYSRWLAAVGGDQHWKLIVTCSLPAYLRRLGAGDTVGKIASLFILGWSVGLAAFRRPTIAQVTILGLAAGVLASPLAWYNYCVFLIPAYVDGQLGRAGKWAALLLFVPPGIVDMGRDGSLWLMASCGAIYPMAFMLIFMSLSVACLDRPGNARISPPEVLR